MANVKISELPLGTPNSTSIFPFVDGGTTYQGAISAITSSGGSVIETDYSTLQDMVNGGGLSTGSYYIITDFRTCYDQPDFDYNKSPITGDNYKEGPIDPIIVFATSANTLSTTAFQPSYPNDKIQYDVYFSQTEVTGGQAYGRITERIDEFNNRTDYDHRVIQFKRYRYIEARPSDEYNGTISTTVTSETEMTVTGTSTSFNSLSVGDYVSFEYNDYRVYEITNIVSDTEMTLTGLTVSSVNDRKMFPAYAQNYTIYYQNNVSTTDFEEYYTFDYNQFVVNNYIGNYSNLYQDIEETFMLANNVFIGSNYRNNTFGNGCYNNSFDDDCENNRVGNYFYNNSTDDDFDGNVIGNYFYDNRITSNFQYNRVGENFYSNYLGQISFYRNNIGNDFRENEITGDDFQNNEIGNQFNNNIIRNGQFYKNDIGNGFVYNRVFWNFYGNLIGNGFNDNELYCHFYDNVIGDYYENNNIGDINNPSNYEFYRNKIGYDFYDNSITANTYDNIFGNDFNNNIITGETRNNVIGNVFQYNTITDEFNNNKIENEFKGNVLYNTFELNNVDSFVGGNNFSGSTSNNIIGSFTFDNDFLGSVSENNWRDGFYGNTIGENFNSNTIGVGFYGNTIGTVFEFNQINSNFNNNNVGNQFKFNTIGDYFYGNTIGENFGFGFNSSQGNKVGNYFYENTVGEYFYNNSIPDTFFQNNFGDYFQWNNFKTSVNSIDFTLYYGNVSGFSYTYLGSTVVNGVYLNLSGVATGNGQNATFNVTVTGDTVTDVELVASGNEYFVNDTIRILGSDLGGVTGVIQNFSSNPIGLSGTTGVYNSVSATGGSGTGATFNITVTDNLVSDISLAGDGTGYTVSDQLIILGSLFGGTDGENIIIQTTIIYSDDVVVTVTGVTSFPSFYYTYSKEIFERTDGLKRLSYYDENDVLTIEPLISQTSITITPSDFSNGGPIYLNTTALGVNGNLGFENTAPENNIDTGYYGQGLNVRVRSQIINVYQSLGLDPNNATGYIWNVTWGAGSSISTGLVKLGLNSNGAYFDIQTIDPADPDWELPGYANGTSLVGTFKFPATFTPYLPLINKGGWC